MNYSNLLGIDVSEASIKVLQLGEENTIIGYKSVALPYGVVKQGGIFNEKVFAEKLSEVLKGFRIDKSSDGGAAFSAVLCIPESKLFSHNCVIPDDIIKATAVEDFVRDEAQKIIPFSLENLYWNYHVALEQGKRSATFIGVARADLDNFVKPFTQAKVNPTFVGGEMYALGRALLPDPPFEDNYMILDIGANTTTIGAFSIDSIPNMSVIVQQGGNYFTQYLSEWLGITMEEGEKMKRTYGLNGAHSQTRVPEILRECLLTIIQDLKEAKKFFEQKTGKTVNHIILAGGSALLPNICNFISEQVGIEVVIGDPLQKLKERDIEDKTTPELLLANVVGLALCEKKSDFLRLNLLAQYQQDDTLNNEDKGGVYDFHSFRSTIWSLGIFAKRVGIKLLPVIGYIKKKLENTAIKYSLTVVFCVLAIALLVFVVTKYV